MLSKFLRPRLCPPVIAAVLCVVVPRGAGAQTPDDLARARDLFNQASAQRDAGDARGALEKFKAAHSLAVNPITTFELASTYALVGQLVEAREAYLSILALPVQPEETDRATQARRDAPKAAEDLRARIPTISVKIAEVPTSTVAISFDGAAAPAAVLVAPRPVDPGTHRLAAIGADGKRIEQEVTLREGESRQVELVVPLAQPASPSPAGASPDPSAAPLSAVVPSSQALPSSPPPQTASSGNHFGPFAYLGFGIGIVGFATGTVLAASALSKSSSAIQCTTVDCSQSALDDISAIQNLAVQAVVSYVIAGVGVAIGLADLVLYSPGPKEPSAKVSIHPWIGAGTAGLSGSF